ncbi:MAG: phosphoglycerate kinase [Candidatus Niyogibacteria bacterium]|nr:phosphoglycerate kinase [Candidatus Niyogibacteria bacterium]
MKFQAIPTDVKGQRVLLRVDFNVPMEGGRVADDFRIAATLPTIRGLAARGARVILMTHLDMDGQRPSLRPIADHLAGHLPNVMFVDDVRGGKAEAAVSALEDGDILLLDNLRRDDGEVANTTEFAKRLATFGDLYINEAFSVSHRKHASVVGVPQYLVSYAGPRFGEEVRQLSRAFDPPHPFLFILGGKKISTKVPLLEKFLKKADTIVLGGVSAALLLKSRGFEDISVPDGEELSLMRAKFANEPKIPTPLDAVVDRGGERLTLEPALMKAGDTMYDIGPETAGLIVRLARESKFILWNGPVGYCEGGFTDGTRALAEAFARVNAEVIVGGGDTVRFLNAWGMLDTFSFVSTGGGAMLDFLVNETLPGIEALAK